MDLPDISPSSILPSPQIINTGSIRLPGYSSLSVGRNHNLSGATLPAYSGGEIITADNAMFHSAMSDIFFNFPQLSPSDYNQLYPYRLVMYGLPGMSSSGMSIELPIGPQNITMNVPAATSISVTMKGIVEDSNAAPLRSITINATTGIMPIGAMKQSSSGTSNLLEYAFQNTIQSFNSTISEATNVINDVKAVFNGSSQQASNRVNYADLGNDATATGYYFFHCLQRFLDLYLATKKTREGRTLRLAFYMFKDKMYWDVILNGYSFSKQAGTLEYAYTLNLTAYRRRTAPIGTESHDAIVRSRTKSSLNAIQNALKALKDTRKTVSEAFGILTGIQSDIQQSFMQPLRDCCMLAGEVVSGVHTVADFGKNIVNILKNSVNAALAEGSNTYLNNALTENDFNSDHSQNAAASLVGVTGPNINQADLATAPDSANPINAIYQNPDKYVAIFDLIDVDTLVLSREAQNAINAEKARVNALQVTDLQQRRDLMSSYAQKVSAGMGGYSATYNRIFNLPTPTTTQSMTTDYIRILSALNDAVMAADTLIAAYKNIVPTPTDDYFSFYTNYATSNGLTIPQSNSKYYVPFPYDGTLESLAVQYLKDVNRWHEIAALNALKEPYVDEVGFDIYFSSNGSGNSIILPNAENLYINETVEVWSNTKGMVYAQIASINKISTVETIVQFAIGVDLTGWTVADQAKVHAYAPNTVNSTKLIAIPSTAPVDATLNSTLKLAPGISDLNKIAQIAKVDLLLQSSGDLVFTSNDVKLAAGLTNLVQAATLRLQTKQGDILNIPLYGNPIRVGTPASEIDLKQFLKDLNAQFQGDARFGGVLAAQMKMTGPSVPMNLLFNVANTGVNLPISTSLPI